ncbi:hypothetical protein FBU30_007435 [Linnemannia zychae]|nr:hypothetical protein FBU30_007435 [Linnemannia zychae]
MSSTAEAGVNECNNRCQIKLSIAVERCIKMFPVTNSDARLNCNNPAVEAEYKCENSCNAIGQKCWDRCFLKANKNWEPCVTNYKDPKDPLRIQCIKDVDNALIKFTASLIAIIGVLAVVLSSVNAQGDPVCIKRCDEAFSGPLGDCILAHPNRPKNPERQKCVGDAYYEWKDCLENCYD